MFTNTDHPMYVNTSIKNYVYIQIFTTYIL